VGAVRTGCWNCKLRGALQVFTHPGVMCLCAGLERTCAGLRYPGSHRWRRLGCSPAGRGLTPALRLRSSMISGS